MPRTLNGLKKHELVCAGAPAENGHAASAEKFAGDATAVFAHARQWLAATALTPAQRRLLLALWDGFEKQDGAAEWPSHRVPLLVHAAITGTAAPAVPLAIATSLLFLGIDILDDLADGDRPAHWENFSAAEIQLAAATLTSALPQLLIAELSAPPATICRMQQTLARGLLRMSAGQQADLAHTGGNDVSAAAVENSVAAKSGEELAMFAALAAQLAGAEPDTVTAYADFARALGTAAQLSNDCHDLFADPRCRDLAHGARTLPVVLRLEKLTGADRAEFLDRLEAARTQETARESVRRNLRLGGELRHCAVLVEVCLQRARRRLAQAQPTEPAAAQLRALLDAITFFPK